MKVETDANPDISVHALSHHSILTLFFFFRFYLFESEQARARAGGKTKGEGEADCLLSREPDNILGLDPRTPGP